MSGIATSPATALRFRRPVLPRPRSEAKRTRIIDAAMHHFAEQGYHAARVGDIAAQLGIAKGSIFQHFGSKDGLFFEVYKKLFAPCLHISTLLEKFERVDFLRFCVIGW